MTLTPQELDNLCTEKSIKSALKVWGKSKELGEEPLAKLKIVETQRQASGYGDNPDGYGVALRAVLDKAIKTLKPTESEPATLTKPWRPYFILTQKNAGRSQKYIADRLAIAQRTYRREQSKAFQALANILREQELELEWKQEPAVADRQKEQPVDDQAQKVKAVSEVYVPFMAPRLPRYALVGRDQMLANLRRRLFAGDMQDLALFALKGLPGVGKSALAVTLAHDSEVRSHFKDGVLWAGLGRQPNVLALLSSWGIGLGIPGSQMGQLTTIEDRARAINAAIGTRRMLLVVDDAWQIEHALAFKLGGPNCAHLLTTRLPDLAWDFADEGARAVQELNESDSLALLSQFVPQLIIKHREEAAELVQAVGGLPLALILMGRYLQKSRRQQNALPNLLKELQHAVRRLELSMHQSPLEKQPSLPYGVPLSLLASIEISDEALEKPAPQMLRALSVFPAKPNTFSEEAALTVADKPAKTLKMLIEAGLLEISGPERYTLHQAIADYARLKNPDPDPDYRRAADYFAAFAQQHSDTEGYSLLDLDWRNISHSMQWAYEHQQWPTLLDGVQGLTDHNLGVVGFMDARGYWSNARELLPKGLEGAKALGDRQVEASILAKMGGFAGRQAQFEMAEGYLQQCLEVLKELPLSDDVVLQYARVCECKFVLEMRRDPQAALSWAEEGLAKLKEVENRTARYEVGYLHVISSAILYDLGQHKKAIQAAEEGLALLPSSPTSARIIGLTTLSNVSSQLGDLEKSIEYQKQGIKIAQDLGDTRRLAILWTSMGLDEGNRGNFSDAVTSLEQSLEVYQKMGDIDGEKNARTNLGLFYIVLGEDKPAERHLKEAIRLSETYQLIKGEAYGRTYLANLLIYQNKVTEAESALARAYKICVGRKFANLLPAVLYWQAEVARKKGQHDQALTRITKSLQMAKKVGYLLEEGIAWSIKGKILDAMQSFDEAEKAHQTSLEILGKHYPYERAQSQQALAEHFVMRDGIRSDRAKSLLTEALATFKRLGAKREIRQTKALLLKI